MLEPKSLIYSKLSEIEGIRVYQIRPEVLSTLDVDGIPIVTFFISSNVPDYNLNSEIDKQAIEITVDIWGKTSKDTGATMVLVEQKMREIKYLLTHQLDVPDTETTELSHLNLRFTY